MRRGDDALDRKTGAALERGNPPKPLRDRRLRLLVAVKTAKLARDVIVAVDDQRENGGVRRKQRGRSAVDQPPVEWDRGEAHVVSVAGGVLNQLAVVEEPVGGPVEVGIVHHESRARRWWGPTLLSEDLLKEVHQR